MYLLKRTEIRISKRYLDSYVYCGPIHNNQKMKLPKWSISRMNKENVAYTYNGKLFNHKKYSSHRRTNTWIQLDEVSKVVKLIETQSITCLTECGERDMGNCSTGIEWKVLEKFYTTLCPQLTILHCVLKTLWRGYTYMVFTTIKKMIIVISIPCLLIGRW